MNDEDKTASQSETDELKIEEKESDSTSESMPLSLKIKRSDDLEAVIMKDMENLMNAPLLKEIQQSQDLGIADQKSNSRGDPDQDCNPLIEEASKENKENENMPFGFFKKKETEAEVDASKTGTEAAADSKTAKSADVLKNGETAKESTKSEEDSSKVTADKDGNAAVAFTTSPTDGTDGVEIKEGAQPPKTSTKTEKSPLIEADAAEAPEDGKESKVRDHSPGFLCCTIL